MISAVLSDLRIGLKFGALKIQLNINTGNEMDALALAEHPLGKFLGDFLGDIRKTRFGSRVFCRPQV